MTAACKGRAAERLERGRAVGRLESLACAPQQLSTGPLPAPHPAFAALGCALSLRSGHRAGLSGLWQDAAPHKNYQQLDAAQGTPRPTQSSVCPLTATKRVLPPTQSTGPSHRPEQILPAPHCTWHPRKKGNPRVKPSALKIHLVIPSSREHLRAGDRHCPMASHALDLAHQDAPG